MKPFLIKFLFLVLIFTSTTSCSVFSFRRDQEPETPETKKSQQVTKKEYDALKSKYNSLLQATQTGGGSPVISDKNLMNDLASAPGVKNKNFQTVDVFSDYPETTGSSTASGMMATGVDKEINELRRVSMLLNKGDFDNGMNMLKPLESSKTKQIRTQAKFLLAESLFMQNEFDLAMQVYEEIIRKDAYSSIIIKTLGRLIACSEKLQLKEKKEKYYSLLHDFFEAG